MTRFIGLMSGTSLDGVDGVLVDFEGGARPRLLAHVHQGFEAALRGELLALNARGPDELHRAALAANGVSRAYADVVAALLQATSLGPADVRAVGAHGQTVRHRPGLDDGVGYTVQLLNGALLAELGGIDVVCDLRSRDLAAGGQGAPLVPAFHAAIFGDASQAVAALNVGGIANLTLLPPGGPVLGFDTGPGNLLLDLWCRRHTGQPYDRDGAWAASGTVHAGLLKALRADAYFDRAPPKSTGRDDFHGRWLEAALARLDVAPVPQDVQATLLELTAGTVADALRRHGPSTQRLVVCGGGAFNGALMARLQALLAPVQVVGSAAMGVAPDHVEAMAFAWLARAWCDRRPGSLPEVTGARGPRVLGALYPAR